MIYIITPYTIDFKRQCELIGYPYFGGGMSYSNVKWINSVHQLYGRKIFKEDKIIYGEQYDQFSDDEIERFKVEISIRSLKI